MQIEAQFRERVKFNDHHALQVLTNYNNAPSAQINPYISNWFLLSYIRPIRITFTIFFFKIIQVNKLVEQPYWIYTSKLGSKSCAAAAYSTSLDFCHGMAFHSISFNQAGHEHAGQQKQDTQQIILLYQPHSIVQTKSRYIQYTTTVIIIIIQCMYVCMYV